jgi:glutamyl-tRNA reductase
LEIYAFAREIASGRAAIESFLSRLQGLPPSTLKPHLYFMHDRNAVTHLMRVAAGLDSMILGESQILGQVVHAYQSGRTANTCGPVLSQLFTQAAHMGKRARTETEISRHTTSVSHAAALLAEEKVGALKQARILVIGAGEMAQVAVQAFQSRGAEHISVINRTYSSAQDFAAQIGVQPIPWHQLDRAVAETDVLTSATGAPHIILGADDIQRVLPRRDGRNLICIDIALPRDIAEAVGDLPGVEYFDLDDLQTVVDENMAQREATVPQVERMIMEEVQSFSDWLSSRQVVPVITDLRAWANEIASSELGKALNRMEHISDEDRKVVELLAHRIVNKLLYQPTLSLRKQAAHGNGYVHAAIVRDLFGLAEASSQPHPNGHSNGGAANDVAVLTSGESVGG